MEQPDNTDNMLEQFFRYQRDEVVIQRALQIRAVQNAIKHQPIESSTLWRIVADSLKGAHVDPKELSVLANISSDDAQYLVSEIRPEPFTLSSVSMANVLITFNISIKKLEALLKNALVAKYASETSQRAVARSSETIGNKERARSIQDGINALFIQVNNEASARADDSKPKLLPDDQTKLESYLSGVTIELKKLDAEYLLL